MKILLLVMGAFICFFANAREALEPTISGRQISFSVESIPERASVVVWCKFKNLKDKESYAFVTPQFGAFSSIERVVDYPYDYVLPSASLPLGSKIYLRGVIGDSHLGIAIVGVTYDQGAIIMDMSHASEKTTVSCMY